MANGLPDSAATAATAAMAAANAAASAAISSSRALRGTVRAEHNLRLIAIYDRLSLYFNGLSRFEAFDAIPLCFSLAKGIDCSLTLNDIPGIASRLPPLVKKVYEWRNNADLQSAIMMVLISIKNACRRRWFQPAESEELLCMVYEFWSKFCTEVRSNTLISHPVHTISTIMPKFYPHLMLCSLIAYFEAKPGYDVLMSDFYYPKTNPPGQNIVLIVIKTESFDTSSCIASPPQVSFLVNGKGVEKRNNLSLDQGPQLPTDISTMLKNGINVIQTIGYFDGTYLIAVAYMSRKTTFTPALKDYVQPAVAALSSDSEIIEGPSRISLCCPISFKRIKTPVKGHLCKHHQCFDYENFLEMNSRKPNWRCPHCNQPVCMIDLRIDKNMVKILEEMGEDVSEVAIQVDGSWNVVAEHETYTDQFPNGTEAYFQAENMECEPKKSRNSIADPVDLTMEDDDSDPTGTQRQEVSLDGFTSQCWNNTLETEDRKPFIDIGGIPVSQVLANPPLANHSSNAAQIPPCQLGNSMQPTIMPSYDSNGSVDSARPPHLGSSQTPPNMFGNLVITDALSPVLDQSQFAVHALPVMGNLTERMAGRPIPRHVDRIPIAVQALPAPQQAHSASRRLQANLLDTAPLVPNNLSPGQYQAGYASTTTLENISGGIGNMDMQQVTGTADTSAMQDHAQPNHQYIVNSSALQQVVGLTSPNTTNNRSPFSQRRRPSDMDAFRASMQPSSYTLNSLHTSPGFRTNPSMRQAPNVLPQSPRLPPSSVRLASQNSTGLASGNIGNQRNKTPPPVPARPLLSPTANSQPSRDNSRALGTDRWRSLTGGMPSPFSRSDALPELPSEQNWIPGLMRGSLIGEDYSAVLTRYMPLLSQPATARPTPSSSAPSATDQVSTVIANNLMAQMAVNPQANSSQDNLGAQQGDTGI